MSTPATRKLHPKTIRILWNIAHGPGAWFGADRPDQRKHRTVMLRNLKMDGLIDWVVSEGAASYFLTDAGKLVISNTTFQGEVGNIGVTVAPKDGVYCIEGIPSYWTRMTKRAHEYPEGTWLRENGTSNYWVRRRYGWDCDGVFTRDDPKGASHVLVPAVRRRWLCGLKGCSHQNESLARDCMTTRVAQETKLKAQLPERRATVERSSNPFDLLGTRARNCLIRENLVTVGDVRKALTDRTLLRTPNLGLRTLREIEFWIANLAVGN